MSVSLWVSLILLTLSLAALMVSPQVIYTRLVYLWLFLISSSYFLAKTGFTGLELRRQARLDRAEVGQVFEEVYLIKNRSRFPKFWIEIHDHSELPGSRASRVLTLIGARGSRTFVSRTRLISRGIYRLGPTELRTGDLFGLFSNHLKIESSKFLMVYPRLVDFYDVPTPPGLLPGGEAVSRRTHQITPNAATVREYATGDPISRIHWPSVARRNRLIVKEFELDPLAEVWILLDAEKRVHAYLPHTLESDAGSVISPQKRVTKLAPATSEYSATLAASLAKHYLQVGRTVGYAAAGAELTILPAERGGRQLNKIIESTAILKTDGETTFTDFALRQVRHLPRGCTLFLITPSVDEEIVVLGEQLHRLGQRFFMLLLDAASFGGNPGTNKLAKKLNLFGVPNVVVNEGQDLSGILTDFKRSPIARQTI